MNVVQCNLYSNFPEIRNNKIKVYYYTANREHVLHTHVIGAASHMCKSVPAIFMIVGRLLLRAKHLL